MITLLQSYPAALIKAQNTRVIAVADLHIGWEFSLSKKGIHIPTQTPKLLAKLTSLILKYRPDRLLILGDVKHTVATAETGEWHDIPDFFNKLREKMVGISIVRGNHDGNLEPLLPSNITVLPASGIIVGSVGFFHGHQWPSPAILESRTLVMGHIHPVVAFRDPGGFRVTRQVWVKVSCDRAQLAKILFQKHKQRLEKHCEPVSKYHNAKPATLQLLIMPSFNEFLGGNPLNERRLRSRAKYDRLVSPVLRSKAVNMENSEMYLLDGTFLGTLSQLKTLG